GRPRARGPVRGVARRNLPGELDGDRKWRPKRDYPGGHRQCRWRYPDGDPVRGGRPGRREYLDDVRCKIGGGAGWRVRRRLRGGLAVASPGTITDDV
ncbi:MAG: hypothetical protein AVDCRST_MAG87-3431, partial [uncultured Thermomicrobiales bacterium]